MAVIELEYSHFDEWLDHACGYIANESEPQELRNQVCEGLIETIVTICQQWTQKQDPDEAFALIVKYPNDKGFAACVHDKCAQLQVIPQWYDAMRDTAQVVAEFQLDVLDRQGIFQEALENQVPYLRYWYDGMSGLYKYSTQLPETKTSRFGMNEIKIPDSVTNVDPNIFRV